MIPLQLHDGLAISILHVHTYIAGFPPHYAGKGGGTLIESTKYTGVNRDCMITPLFHRKSQNEIDAVTCFGFVNGTIRILPIPVHNFFHSFRESGF
jgi:hypothetical protein